MVVFLFMDKNNVLYNLKFFKTQISIVFSQKLIIIHKKIEIQISVKLII